MRRILPARLPRYCARNAPMSWSGSVRSGPNSPGSRPPASIWLNCAPSPAEMRRLRSAPQRSAPAVCDGEPEGIPSRQLFPISTVREAGSIVPGSEALTW